MVVSHNSSLREACLPKSSRYVLYKRSCLVHDVYDCIQDVPHFTHWLKGLKAAAAKPTQTPVANGNAESHAGNGTTPAKEVVAPAEPVSEAAAETITGGTGEPVPTGTQTTTT